MKIVFLNCWQGELPAPLKDFIQTHRSDTDVFCLQEINGTEAMLDDILGTYTKCYANKNDPFNQELEEQFEGHMATFVRPGIEVVRSAPLLQNAIHNGFGVYTELAVGTKPIHLINLHGYPWPGKLDTPLRLEQSKAFLETFQSKGGTRIIGGDLNVLPETQSVQMFVNGGYRDLVSDYNIKTTRNHLSWDRFPDNPLYYSDYVFVDHNTTVTNFTVPDMEISDHLPLILEIQL